jgi:tetratricopeptide (TPR) repeat protein
VGHNNASYHAILLGDLAAARHHVQIGLALAEELALPITHQWLFSTSGEIALAEQKWEEAETWFTRGLAEAERYGNPEMAAGCRANLGLAARGRGDLDQALVLLEEARQMAPALQLKTQIDLWLADLYLQRGERAAAREALARAEAQLGDERRERLRIQAIHLHTLLSPNTGSDEAAGR